MNTFAEFIEKSKTGLCKEYTEKLDKAGSKKAMIDLALDANGMQWTAEAVAKGELSPATISNDFKPFLNGNFTRIGNGFTSQIYCQPPEDEIKITTTATLIIGFKGKVIVDRPCRLYLCKSDVTIIGTATPEVYLYNSTIVNDNCFVNVRERKEY